MRPLLRAVALVSPIALSACVTARVEYDRMTATAFPDPVTVDGEDVNFQTMYMQGDRLLTVNEDDEDIAALTGPANPADPNQYDYITTAELETLELANRSSSIGSVSWSCRFWIFRLRCTRYHVYGIVVDHWRELDSGVRETSTMGLMYDPDERRAFTNYWKNSTVSSDNGKYLRSAAHEVGHTFNLNHCDGDGATTIMNQTFVVGDDYTYEFSASSLEHLQDHDDDVVWPGLGVRHYACPHVH